MAPIKRKKSVGVGALIDTSSATILIAAHAYLTRAKGQFDTQKSPETHRQTGLQTCLDYVLAGGDDYELAFTAPAAKRDAVQAAARVSGTPVTRIGQIEAQPGLRLIDAQGHEVANTFPSFDHFA